MWISLAKTYEKERLWEKALFCYDRAQNMATALERRDAVIEVEYRIGHIYLEKHERRPALEHLRAALQVAEEEGDRNMIARIDAYLSFLDTP
jgi:tetratricopeptide (TPR) repeat protein